MRRVLKLEERRSSRDRLPQRDGVERPWHVGVLWDRDPRLAVPLIANLVRLHGLTVGDNEPYSARDPHGFTLRHHANPRGLPNVLLEMRQDEVGTPFCITVDGQTLTDGTVTVRDRDTLKQWRVKAEDCVAEIKAKLLG